MSNLRKLIQEFSRRSLLKDHSKLIESPPKGQLSAYVGFDPSADKIHLGNYLQMITLARVSDYDFHPIFLIGGATGWIGDPSGKTAQRTQLKQNVLLQNQERMQQGLNTLATNLKTYL